MNYTSDVFAVKANRVHWSRKIEVAPPTKQANLIYI